MGARRLVAETLAISPSGALSPGPLSAAAIALGSSLGLAGGLAVALGHMAFEFPYVALLSRAAARVRRLLEGRVGGALLLFMAGFTGFFAWGLIEAALAALGGSHAPAVPGASAAGGLLGAFAVGILYTGANPFFLAWWATAGFPLVEGASRIPGGLALMYASHVWMDYAWLGLLAAGGGAAGLLGSRGYAALLGALGAVLAYYAARFALEAFRVLSGRGGSL